MSFHLIKWCFDIKNKLPFIQLKLDLKNKLRFEKLTLIE